MATHNKTRIHIKVLIVRFLENLAKFEHRHPDLSQERQRLCKDTPNLDIFIFCEVTNVGQDVFGDKAEIGDSDRSNVAEL